MKLYTDSLHKIAYATDASVYREIPYGVAYPETEEDIRSLMDMARQKGIDLIPRAAGTSIAGQVVGSGIVVDISKHWNKIIEINAEERWARVQPGVVRDELNQALKPYGLFFSPETSTSNRCCIGGMFGNNSCGTHSLVYGSTRHHVIACKGILADGSTFDTRKVDNVAYRSASPLLDKILTQLEQWAKDEDTRILVRDSFPDKILQRRSCGYAIDEAIEDVWLDSGKALCKLLAGSEGTLAFITEITVSLDPLPPKEVMVVCGHCDDLMKSFWANLVALRHHPTAVELMDGEILELSKGIPTISSQLLNSSTPQLPNLLITELRADTREELDSKADMLEMDLQQSGLIYKCTRAYGPDVSKVWNLRKAGLGVLGGMKGDARPMGVIEDTAVAPMRLPAYMKDFREMLHRLDAKCVFYGHISTGELHLRPILNLKTREGRELFRTIANETALLVKKHRGTISGEHGDGRLRGEFIPLLYGPEAYELMRQLKHCWDPDGLLNRHKIVDTLPMDSMLRFSEDQQYNIEELTGSDHTYFNWKAAFDECHTPGATGARSQTHALMCTIEQCNGAADCRKSNAIGGTLCPAYKVSRDELKTTRARANVLREVLTRGDVSMVKGQWSKVKGQWSMVNGQRSMVNGQWSMVNGQRSMVNGQWSMVKEVLDSCLACKGCRGECPSNVDMTRIRAELLQHYYNQKGTPRRAWLVARMAQIERLGRLAYSLYNFAATWKPAANIIKRIVSFAPERSIPQLSRRTMVQLVKQDIKKTALPNPRKRVYLYADEFTNQQEAELGQTFAKLLMRLGYQVEIPNLTESGRAAISKGCLKHAKRIATENVKRLTSLLHSSSPQLLIGIEPSTILTFRDEYPDLVPAEMRDEAIRIGKSCLLYDEFLEQEMKAGNISADDFKADKIEIWLHGHCHQKALVGIENTVTALKLLRGANVHVIPSGCCGMAGSFGYEKEHYKTSLAIGEMVLFPTVRKIVSPALPLGSSKNYQLSIGNSYMPTYVAAPGTSCRQQILDGTGVRAVHPIEILYKYLGH